MPDDQKPITDEAIDSIVSMTEAAEVMASTMKMPVPTALRFMLKSMQVMQRLKQRGFDLSTFESTSKKVQ
jgi:hypothetical protein